MTAKFNKNIVRSFSPFSFFLQYRWRHNITSVLSRSITSHSDKNGEALRQMVREASTPNHQTISERLDRHSSDLSSRLRLFHPKNVHRNINEHFFFCGKNNRHQPFLTSGYAVRYIYIIIISYQYTYLHIISPITSDNCYTTGDYMRVESGLVNV